MEGDIWRERNVKQYRKKRRQAPKLLSPVIYLFNLSDKSIRQTRFVYTKWKLDWFVCPCIDACSILENNEVWHRSVTASAPWVSHCDVRNLGSSILWAHSHVEMRRLQRTAWIVIKNTLKHQQLALFYATDAEVNSSHRSLQHAYRNTIPRSEGFHIGAFLFEYPKDKRYEYDMMYDNT
jgi:hypothetical protein